MSDYFIAPRSNKPTRILFEDEHLVVVVKPEDLLSVPGKHIENKDCLIRRLHKTHPTALIVHRLDMATSGIMVIAKTTSAHRQLSIQFQNREVEKEYIAVVHGAPSNDSGQIEAPLICDWPNRPKQKVDEENGKPALTHYQVEHVDKSTNTSRLLLKPHTGRTHQLRVHCLTLGTPILGDRLYAPAAIIAASPRLLLHAARIQFTHPNTDAVMCFSDDPDF